MQIFLSRGQVFTAPQGLTASHLLILSRGQVLTPPQELTASHLLVLSRGQVLIPPQELTASHLLIQSTGAYFIPVFVLNWSELSWSFVNEIFKYNLICDCACLWMVRRAQKFTAQFRVFQRWKLFFICHREARFWLKYLIKAFFLWNRNIFCTNWSHQAY